MTILVLGGQDEQAASQQQVDREMKNILGCASQWSSQI